MGRILVFLLASAIFATLVSAIPLTYLPPVYYVIITAPVEDEDVSGGRTYRIKWDNTDGISFAAVYYSADGGKSWETLYACNKNAGRHDWVVPEDPTGDAVIKVEVWNDCNAITPLATDTVGFEVKWTPPKRPCECDSCISCSQMLEGSCETVYLGRDISSSSGRQCVVFDSDGKTFDCEGHGITGGATGQEFYYGIFAGGRDITIRNCEISKFEVGIDLHGVDGGLITNNTLLENYGSGMFIADSEDVRIEDNTIEDSGQGIFLGNTKDAVLQGNRICGSAKGDIFSSPWSPATGSTRNDNICDVIYNWNNDGDVTWCDEVCNAGTATIVGTASSLQDALDGEYGTVELIHDIVAGNGLSVDTSHVTIDCNGHKIIGSGSGTGVLMVNRVNNELRNCIIEHFDTGVELRGTSHSRIVSNEVAHNDYGLIIRDDALPSRSNIIDKNTIKPNSIYGVYLYGDAFDNTFTDNTLLGQHYSLYTSGNCNNNIDTTNIGGLIKKIGYFHDVSGLTIDSTWGYRDFSELILCNVSDSQFRGVSVNNGATGSDGVLIINSKDVEFTTLTVDSSYQGVTITNSNGISFQTGSVSGMEQDCVKISQSSGIEIDDMDTSECDTGFSLAFSHDCTIENLDISGARIAGISLYDSDRNRITRVEMDGDENAEVKGIYLIEDSDDNQIYMADIRNAGTGVHIDDTSDGNFMRENIFCDNILDVSNYGNNNTGHTNKCTINSLWKDAGVGRGCAYCCPNIRSDIDEDGIDDAYDCNDLLQGHNEFGTDCGGRCPDCVECTWCDSKVEPLRIRGHPNDGYIDIMFVPEEDFEGNFSGFLNEVKDTIRMRFLGLNKTSTRPIYEGYEDMFNFYVYTGGYGKTTGSDAYYCYNPEGPEGNICIGCAGWLPGEKEYFDWVYSCSFACALTLGLGCACFAYEPDHFWEHASFVDSAGILTERDIRGCSLFGPTSHYSGSYCGNRGIMIIHEAGHSLFALTDEYCGDAAYSRASHKPNVWNSMSDCQSAAASEGWTDGSCRQIREGDCSKDKYRYDSDSPEQDIMSGGCGSLSNAKFKEADVRRINYVFEHWPSGGSKGIISYVDFRNSTMKHLLSRVVPNHPDLGMWARDFSAITQSAGGKEIDAFSFGDPRRINIGDGPALEGEPFMSETAFPLIVPMHENVRWLHIFNGTSGEEMVTIDLGPAIWNYCNESEWKDEYCRTVDLNNNGIPDYREGWSLEEAIEVMKENPPEAEAPDLNIEPEVEESVEKPIPKPEWVEKLEKPVIPVGGVNLSPIILVLTVVILLVLGLFLMRKLRRGTEKLGKKPAEEAGICRKCGARIDPGSRFCPKCGEVVEYDKGP